MGATVFGAGATPVAPLRDAVAIRTDSPNRRQPLTPTPGHQET